MASTVFELQCLSNAVTQAIIGRVECVRNQQPIAKWQWREREANLDTEGPVRLRSDYCGFVVYVIGSAMFPCEVDATRSGFA